jgi:TolB protein
VILSLRGVVAFAASPLIAFEQNNAVWIADLDGTGEKSFADGKFPAISPDGRRVAYTTAGKPLPVMRSAQMGT